MSPVMKMNRRAISGRIWHTRPYSSWPLSSGIFTSADHRVVGGALDHHQRAPRQRGALDVVTGAGQHPAHQRGIRFLVVHHQRLAPPRRHLDVVLGRRRPPQTTARRHRRRARRRRRCTGSSDGATIDDSAITGSSIVNTAPPTSSIARRNLPAVLANDAVTHRQAEAGALANFARGEERIEDARQILFLQAAAVVRHLDEDSIRIALQPRGDLDLAARLSGTAATTTRRRAARRSPLRRSGSG